MAMFSTVGLIGRPGSHHIDEALRRLIHFLLERDHQVVVEEGYAYLVEETSAAEASGVSVAPLQEMGASIDLAVVLGGDGSMLGAGRALCESNTPLVGINGGRVGFLTDVAAEEMEQHLGAILEGHYQAERRLLLDSVVVRDGKPLYSAHALNDVVVHSGQVARLIEFDLYIDDVFVYRQRSDGLIISTPTGSTAYALSAGGPILSPGLEVVALVPMCPHTLSSRPLVVPADSRIKLKVCEHSAHEPVIACDGQSTHSIQGGDELHIQRRPDSLELLHPVGHSFYESCRSKLGWTLHGR